MALVPQTQDQRYANNEDTNLNTTQQAQGSAESTTVPANTATGAVGTAGLAGVQPAGIQSFGATPQVAATYADAATVNPQQNQQYLTQYEQAVQSALNPTFAQQDMQLQDSSAARGISSSGAAGYLQGNLLGQQAAAVASADEPLIGAEAGYTQADIAANQANQQGVNQQNAAASNTADAQNAATQQQDITDNFGAYNNYVNDLFGAGTNYASAQESAYLNSFGPNTGVESAFNESLGGLDSTYGGAYNTAEQSGSSSLSSLGSTAGSLFGAALESGAV